MGYDIFVKKLRKKLILSQAEFASLLNVSVISVCRWESGKFEPTIKIKRKIADLAKSVKISLEDLDERN